MVKIFGFQNKYKVLDLQNYQDPVSKIDKSFTRLFKPSLEILESRNFRFCASFFLKLCPLEASVAHLRKFFENVGDMRMSTSVDVLRSNLGRLLVDGPP